MRNPPVRDWRPRKGRSMFRVLSGRRSRIDEQIIRAQTASVNNLEQDWTELGNKNPAFRTNESRWNGARPDLFLPTCEHREERFDTLALVSKWCDQHFTREPRLSIGGHAGRESHRSCRVGSQFEPVAPSLLEMRRQHFVQRTMRNGSIDVVGVLPLERDHEIHRAARIFPNDVDQGHMLKETPHAGGAQFLPPRHFPAVAQRDPVGVTAFCRFPNESQVPVDRDRRQCRGENLPWSLRSEKCAE